MDKSYTITVKVDLEDKKFESKEEELDFKTEVISKNLKRVAKLVEKGFTSGFEPSWKIVPNVKVVVSCYGQKRTFEDQSAAISFYKDCMDGSEGSEFERYSRIMSQLQEPTVTFATDEEDY
jgi:hypothetical protein